MEKSKEDDIEITKKVKRFIFGKYVIKSIDFKNNNN